MLNCQKSKFQLDPSVTYLNNAYMSPLLKSVEEAGIQGLIKKRNPFNYSNHEFFDDVVRLKKAFGTLIGAPHQQIAIVPSVSYAMSNVANNLKPRQNGRIVLAEGQFPSHYYTWSNFVEANNQSIQTIKSKPTGPGWIKKWNADILEAIDNDVIAVCLGHCHWADGTLFNLKEISAKCKDTNTYLIIDGTQSVGALPLNLQEIPFDALIVGGYKWLMGHYGLGCAYFSEAFNEGVPIEDNWINKKDSSNFERLVDYTDEFESGAARYSVGEQSSFCLVPMLTAGINQILEWGVDNVYQYDAKLQQRLHQNLEGSDFKIPILGESSGHLTGIRISKDMDMATIKKKLLENNIYVSYRADAIRVSLHVYNDVEDIDKFSEVLLS